METKKSALCNDVADDGGGSEKQRYYLFFSATVLNPTFLNQLILMEIKEESRKLILAWM